MPDRCCVRVLAACSLSLLIAGCGGSDDDDTQLGGAREPFPARYCPGSPGCDGTGDGVFRVGAARAEINPTLVETEWVDENENHDYERGEPFTDVNDNGKFDATWLAGYGTGRPATGFHSDLWVRAMVFEWNDIRLGLAVVDAVGWMEDECERTRAMIPDSLGFDHVLISATHVHEGPDTMGQWGEIELAKGTKPEHQQKIREQIVAALTEAANSLQPVTLELYQVETVDENGSSKPFVGDGRDPVIFDPTMSLLRFVSASNPEETVATLVHWSGHPEYSGSDNNLITADYVYLLREVIENGIAENTARGLPAMDGLGGEVVFAQGMVGGQVGPKHVEAPDLDGTLLTDDSLEFADAVGRNLGRLALETMADPANEIAIDDLDLSVRTGLVDLVVENTYFHVAGLVGVFDREFYGYNETQPITESNLPYVESRVTYVEIGPIGIVTAPGEIHPELAIGGYDGSRSYGEPIIGEDNPNPPDLSQAPAGPYLYDLITANEGIEYPLVIGLGEDEIGYIVPAWNYVLHDSSPYIEEAEGDHYEETNSVGPRVEEQAVGAMRKLITWKPD